MKKIDTYSCMKEAGYKHQKSNLMSDFFWKRSFAILGHGLMAYITIYAVILLITGVTLAIAYNFG